MSISLLTKTLTTFSWIQLRNDACRILKTVHVMAYFPCVIGDNDEVSEYIKAKDLLEEYVSMYKTFSKLCIAHVDSVDTFLLNTIHTQAYEVWKEAIGEQGLAIPGAFLFCNN